MSCQSVLRCLGWPESKPDIDGDEDGKQSESRETRTVWLAPHITRISNINTSEESFRAKFYLTVRWKARKNEVDFVDLFEFMQSAPDNETRQEEKFRAIKGIRPIVNPSGAHTPGPLSEKHLATLSRMRELARQRLPLTLKEKDLCWKPPVTFPNEVEVHSKEWQSANCDIAEVDEAFEILLIGSDLYVRTRLACDITFFEDFECEHLPFDCQDLTIKVESRNDNGHLITFKPDQRQDHAILPAPFAMIKTDLSPITDTWDLAGLAIDFFVKKMHKSSTPFYSEHDKNGRSQCAISIKLARKWFVVVRNELIIILMLAALSMSVFAIEVDDFTDRLAQSLTLLLTTVLYDTRTPTKSYSTLMDTYQLCIYVFMFSIMVANLIEYLYGLDSPRERRKLAHDFGLALSVLHIYFFGLSSYAYFWEHQKIKMGFREVEEHLKGHGSRPQFRAFASTEHSTIFAMPFKDDDNDRTDVEDEPGCFSAYECCAYIESWLHCVRCIWGYGWFFKHILKSLISCFKRCGVSCRMCRIRCGCRPRSADEKEPVRDQQSRNVGGVRRVTADHRRVPSATTTSDLTIESKSGTYSFNITATR